MIYVIIFIVNQLSMGSMETLIIGLVLALYGVAYFIYYGYVKNLPPRENYNKRIDGR